MQHSITNPQPSKRTTSQFAFGGQLFLLASLILVIVLSGCNNNNKSVEDQLLAKERQRIEAERASERDALERELLARSLPAKTHSQALWKQFRQTFPYHSQVLALSQPDMDGSRTLVVSEPPPHVTVGKILLPFGNLLLNHSVNKQRIGHDGWAKDVVIALTGSDQEIGARLSSLNQLILHLVQILSCSAASAVANYQFV